MEVQLWTPAQTTQNNPERFIERCARVAYRSEEKMTDDSYKGFIERVVVKNRDHSVCEHAAYVVDYIGLTPEKLLRLLAINPLIPWWGLRDGYRLLINGRQALELANSLEAVALPILRSLQGYFPTLLADNTWIDNGYDDLGFLYTHPAHTPLPSEYGTSDHTLMTFFIKGVSRVTETQWVRHRRMSFTVMSGRGVDVREQGVVIPPTFEPLKNTFPNDYEAIKFTIERCKGTYAQLRDFHKIPRQDARYLQPQGTATEMVVSSTVTWWNYFWGLRSVKPAQWEVMNFSRATQKIGHELYPHWVSSPPID